MIEVAALFEGEHDFSAFAASDDRDRLGGSKVRNIFSSSVEWDRTGCSTRYGAAVSSAHGAEPGGKR